VGNGVGLVADQIVQAVCGVGVDEAVTDPLARADSLVDVGNDLEGGLDPVLVDIAILDSFDVCLAAEAKDVEGILAGEGDEFARLGPVDLILLVSDGARVRLLYLR
jgi:hypothetical protein